MYGAMGSIRSTAASVLTAQCVSIVYAALSLAGDVCAVLTKFPSGESLWYLDLGIWRVSLRKTHGDKGCTGGSHSLTISPGWEFICVCYNRHKVQTCDLSLLAWSLSPKLFSDAVHFRWRTKQNLDYCFLMMYAQEKGIYYIQVRGRVFTGV